jgi:pilus assembly protein Flp/PilA
MQNQLVSFLSEEAGLTMVEYAVAGTMIVLGAAFAFELLGTTVFLRIEELALTIGL